MRSVADDLRRETYARVLAMPVADRIAWSLALGDEDVVRYARQVRVEPETARRRLRDQRREGRRPSCAAGADPDDTARPGR